MQSQEKLPRGYDFLGRIVDDGKFLKEKCFIWETQYCLLVRVLALKSAHSPTQQLAWCCLLAKLLDLCVQFPSVKWEYQ